MAKRRKRKKQKTGKRTPSAKSRDTDVIYISEYTITDEPMLPPAYSRLPEAVQDRMEELFYDIRIHPREAIEELTALQKLYPHIPQIGNYLVAAYQQAGEDEKAEQIARENLRRHPNYLFARINVAEFLLKRGKYDKIPKLFDNKFDLKMLYPRRNTFHITEVVSFMGLMGRYFAGIGQRETAQTYYNMLREIAPHDPMTKALKRELYPGIVRRIALQTPKRLAAEPNTDEAETP